MKLTFTFLLMFFFTFNYGQSLEPYALDELVNEECTLLTPEYLDYRRIARTSYLDYSEMTMDSVAYIYPFDTSKNYAVANYYSLDSATYNIERVDSLFFDGNDWVLKKRYDWNADLGVFEYNQRIRQLQGDSSLIEKYDVNSGEWTKKSLYIQVEFPSGKVEKFFAYSWDTDSETWKPDFKIVNNELGKLVEFTTTYNQNLYVWDSLGRPVSSVIKNLSGSNLVNSDSISYQWQNDAFLLGLEYKWQPAIDEWEYNKKRELYYDADGILLEEEIYLDSIGVNQYENVVKKVFTYDDEDREVLLLSYNWSGAWKLSLQNIHEYDAAGNIVLFNSSQWDSSLSAFRLKREDRYYYEEYENGLVTIQDLTQVETIVYPNPASADITFNVKGNQSDFDVKIYSSLGRLMLAQKSKGAIDIKNLPAGQYFYILKGIDFGATGSFVKE